MFTKLRESLIHVLGGYTGEEVLNKAEEIMCDSTEWLFERNTVAGEPDEDDLEYARTQIARKLGEDMLAYGLIEFNSVPRQKENGLYTIVTGSALAVKR